MGELWMLVQVWATALISLSRQVIEVWKENSGVLNGAVGLIVGWAGRPIVEHQIKHLLGRPTLTVGHVDQPIWSIRGIQQMSGETMYQVHLKGRIHLEYRGEPTSCSVRVFMRNRGHQSLELVEAPLAIINDGLLEKPWHSPQRLESNVSLTKHFAYHGPTGRRGPEDTLLAEPPSKPVFELEVKTVSGACFRQKMPAVRGAA